jgi:predicted metallopeptidase
MGVGHSGTGIVKVVIKHFLHFIFSFSGFISRHSGTETAPLMYA